MHISGRIRSILQKYEPSFDLACGNAASYEPREAYRLFHPVFLLRRCRHAPPSPDAKALLLAHVAEIHRIAIEESADQTAIVRPLWHLWLLLLSERELALPANEEIRVQLWTRAFRRQSPAGHLHPLTPDTLLDSFVYDELCAIHAAYPIAQSMGDPAMLEQVRRAVRWHVENTQPDNTTHEPWALAAFAALDETGTFAEQQLHDAVTHLNAHQPQPANPHLIIPALLHNALMTFDDTSS